MQRYARRNIHDFTRPVDWKNSFQNSAFTLPRYVIESAIFEKKQSSIRYPSPRRLLSRRKLSSTLTSYHSIKSPASSSTKLPRAEHWQWYRQFFTSLHFRFLLSSVYFSPCLSRCTLVWHNATDISPTTEGFIEGIGRAREDDKSGVTPATRACGRSRVSCQYV